MVYAVRMATDAMGPELLKEVVSVSVWACEHGSMCRGVLCAVCLVYVSLCLCVCVSVCACVR